MRKRKTTNPKKQPIRTRKWKKRRDVTEKYYRAIFTVFGVVLLTACLANYIPKTSRSVAHNQPSDQPSPLDRERKKLSGSDLDSFRSDIQKRDHILIEKFQTTRLARRRNSKNNFSREYYEERLRDLQSQLKNKLIQNSKDKKGTIGWGLLQDIKKLQSDPPPR
ncbi:MAG: hypothetical protein AAGA30_08655 [Planctomycetota bacterium]